MVQRFGTITALCLIVNFSHAAASGNTISITVNGDSVITTLSDHFFGHNYWMWTPTWGNSMPGTESLMSDAKVSFLRMGGTNVDLGYPDPVNTAALTGFSSYCKTINADPLLQLQLAKYSTTADRVSNAAAMVNSFKSLTALTYISIGNEPDIYPENLSVNAAYNAAYLSAYSLTDYCNDFNAVAAEIKKNSPTVKLIGPELSWKRDAWIPGFVSACKNNIDMVSVHYYPFTAAQCVYGTVRDQVTALTSFYTTTRALIDRNAGGKAIPLIVGETNVSWDGTPATSNLSASPGTFNAGLWMADFIGVSTAQKNLFSIMPWSIREGWTLAFLDANKKPYPVYYMYKMFANLAKKYMIHNQTVNSYVRVYGYKDDQNNVSLFTVNWDTASSYKTTIKFSNILGDSSYACVIPPQSLSCITFSSNFKNKNMVSYSKKNESQGPVTNIKSMPLNGSQKKSPLEIAFNEKKSVIAITSDKTLPGIIVSIVNLAGKELLKITAENIMKGTTVIPFNPSIAPGGYILKVSLRSSEPTELSRQVLNIF
jgi:hypothetical protein